MDQKVQEGAARGKYLVVRSHHNHFFYMYSLQIDWELMEYRRLLRRTPGQPEPVSADITQRYSVFQGKQIFLAACVHGEDKNI